MEHGRLASSSVSRTSMLPQRYALTCSSSRNAAQYADVQARKNSARRHGILVRFFSQSLICRVSRLSMMSSYELSVMSFAVGCLQCEADCAKLLNTVPRGHISFSIFVGLASQMHASLRFLPCQPCVSYHPGTMSAKVEISTSTRQSTTRTRRWKCRSCGLHQGTLRRRFVHLLVMKDDGSCSVLSVHDHLPPPGVRQESASHAPRSAIS